MRSVWGFRGGRKVWKALQKITVELDFERLKRNLLTEKME